MKNHWLLAACLIVGVFSSAQQRLAVFSNGNDAVGYLPCISIDFFSNIPDGQLYGLIGDHFTAKYVTLAHTRFDGTAKAVLPAPSGIGYFGVNNEPIPDYYTHFLEGVIAVYKTKLPNDETLYALQNDVWNYNVMDELGFIDRSATNQLEEFKKASAQYSFRYGFVIANPETASAEQTRQTILGKASQVYFNRKYTMKPIEKPDSIQFTDSSIVYRQAGGNRTITTHYHDISIAELEKCTAAFKDAVYVYIQDYRIPPEHADLRRSLVEPADYVLTFSALDGSAKYTMNFLLTATHGSLLSVNESTWTSAN
jgi:hypothetical protein